MSLLPHAFVRQPHVPAVYASISATGNLIVEKVTIMPLAEAMSDPEMAAVLRGRWQEVTASQGKYAGSVTLFIVCGPIKHASSDFVSLRNGKSTLYQADYVSPLDPARVDWKALLSSEIDGRIDIMSRIVRDFSGSIAQSKKV